jgi:natural product precursor
MDVESGIVLYPHMARRPVMNKSKKLELSKETLRSLDDEHLAAVAGGWNNGGGGENNNSFICVSAQQANSCVCQSVLCVL